MYCLYTSLLVFPIIIRDICVFEYHIENAKYISNIFFWIIYFNHIHNHVHSHAFANIKLKGRFSYLLLWAKFFVKHLLLFKIHERRVHILFLNAYGNVWYIVDINQIFVAWIKYFIFSILSSSSEEKYLRSSKLVFSRESTCRLIVGTIFCVDNFIFGTLMESKLSGNFLLNSLSLCFTGFA